MISYDALADLQRIRDRYQNRRTVAHQLLGEVLELAERAIADAEAKAEARKASVPAPNLVTLDCRPAPRAKYEPLPDPVVADAPPRWLVAVNAVLGSRLMVLAVVILVLVAVVKVVIL